MCVEGGLLRGLKLSVIHERSEMLSEKRDSIVAIEDRVRRCELERDGSCLRV